MKELIELLREYMPLWLILITIGCGYLIFLYTKIFRQTNTLAEKQSDYLKDKIEAIDKTTATFERSFKHQEEDLKRVYQSNEKLKEKLKEKEKIELHNLDGQLKDIKDLNSIDETELQKIRKEIEETKLSTELRYKSFLDKIETKENSEQRIKKVEKIYLSISMSNDYQEKRIAINDISEKNKLEINRLDVFVENKSVVEYIKENISTSDLIICDLSGQNPNVMYELGYAHGNNKPVILLANKASEIIFDVSNYKVIIYNNLEDLQTKLDKELKLVVEEINRNAKTSGLKQVRDILLETHPLDISLKVLHQLLG